MRYKNSMTDFRRNNKISIRNFSESVDLHDFCKILLVRMIRRNHPDNNKTVIYTEHDPESKEDYPDIWIRKKEQVKGKPTQGIYVWEIQRNVSEKWLEEITEKHKEVNLIIVDLNKVESKWNERIQKMNGKIDIVNELREVLEDYVI